MSMPALQVENHRYPFGQSTQQPAKIVELQYFKSAEQLQQKKKELTKKVELISNHSIIKMESIKERGMALVYHYEFVPHSFESYLRSKWLQESAEIWSMTKKFFTKKVVFELTLLTSYLGKMKIQTELAIHHLGISKDQKLKLYISPKSKMGIKPEIQLIIVYNQNKQKILKELQNIYTFIENNSQNNTLRTYEPSQNMSTEQQEASQINFEIFGSADIKSQTREKGSVYNLPHSPTQSIMRQTKKFNNSQSFGPRKMSSGHLELNSNSNLFKSFEKSQDNKPTKSHKYSFQFGNPSEQGRFHQNNHKDRQQEPQRSYSKAKSIKIEVEQKQNLDPRRKRKDSYKVKITTVREYDLGQNPTHLFTGRSNNEEDIFEYFAKRSKGKAQQDNLSQDPEKFEDPFKRETLESKFSNQQIPEPPTLFSPNSQKQRKKSDNNIKRHTKLEQRIRQAKERTTKALNLMKNLKK